MIEITSPPVILIAILGTIGMLLPIISVMRKEKGSPTIYAVIAFGALIASLGYIIYEIVTNQIPPAALFSGNVLANDSFSGLFAIAMLIVSIMTTVGSFNFMRNQPHHAVYYSLILYPRLEWCSLHTPPTW